MLYSLEANEASLKLAVSYPDFPGNPSSTVNAAERTWGMEIWADTENQALLGDCEGHEVLHSAQLGCRSSCSTTSAVQTHVLRSLPCL